MEFHSEHINVVLGRVMHTREAYDRLPIASTLEDMKEWLASMIS